MTSNAGIGTIPLTYIQNAGSVIELKADKTAMGSNSHHGFSKNFIEFKLASRLASIHNPDFQDLML